MNHGKTQANKSLEPTRSPAVAQPGSSGGMTTCSPNARAFVETLFPDVDPALLTGLVARVTQLELTLVGEVIDLNLDQQAAVCVKSGALESVHLTDGVWQAFWLSTPGTVFNADGLRRKLKGPCLLRAATRSILMRLSADDFEAELKVNESLAKALANEDA